MEQGARLVWSAWQSDFDRGRLALFRRPLCARTAGPGRREQNHGTLEKGLQKTAGHDLLFESPCVGGRWRLAGADTGWSGLLYAKSAARIQLLGCPGCR